MLEWHSLETTLIDTFFFTTLGLKIGNYAESLKFWLDRLVSIFLLSWALFRFLRLFFKIKELELYKTTVHLFNFEKEVITEGIHPQSYNFVPILQRVILM